MPRVPVVFTGGTISMQHDPLAGGNVPALDGAAILARTPGLDAIAAVESIDLGLTPASHFTFTTLIEIAATLRERLADPDVAGAVVVQGTDTIEETSFFYDLVVGGRKPVVVTGAMRAASDDGYDGPANLRDAVRAAASPLLRDAGCVVVLLPGHAGRMEANNDAHNDPPPSGSRHLTRVCLGLSTRLGRRSTPASGVSPAARIARRMGTGSLERQPCRRPARWFLFGRVAVDAPLASEW